MVLEFYLKKMDGGVQGKDTHVGNIDVIKWDAPSTCPQFRPYLYFVIMHCAIDPQCFHCVTAPTLLIQMTVTKPDNESFVPFSYYNILMECMDFVSCPHTVEAPEMHLLMCYPWFKKIKPSTAIKISCLNGGKTCLGGWGVAVECLCFPRFEIHHKSWLAGSGVSHRGHQEFGPLNSLMLAEAWMHQRSVPAGSAAC